MQRRRSWNRIERDTFLTELCGIFHTVFWPAGTYGHMTLKSTSSHLTCCSYNATVPSIEANRRLAVTLPVSTVEDWRSTQR